MFRNILVPLDGSALSERALAPALQIAELEAGRVTLLRAPHMDVVLAPSAAMFGNYSLRDLELATTEARREAGDYLEAVRRTKVQPDLQVSTALEDGEPAELILDFAERRQVDLIVMSTHGYSGVTRWVLGSVTERVLAHAPCPVLVIRSEKPLARMLITLDGSALSEQVLAPAFEVAAAFQLPVSLLRVIPPVAAQHIAELNQVEHGLGQRLVEEQTADASEYLTRQLSARPGQSLPVETVVRTGQPAASILEYAQAHQADVVAMATHGRTGVQKWLYGSVTEKVLRQSHDFALLLVRPTA